MELEVIADSIEKFLKEEHIINLHNAKMLTYYLSKDIEQLALANTPVQTGKLKKSFKRTPYKTKKWMGVRLSYSAPHALKVHEEPQSKRRTGKRRYLADSSNAIFDSKFDAWAKDLFK